MTDNRPHHHVNDGRPIMRKVFCDGAEVQDVIEANTAQGWYRTQVRAANGDFVLTNGRSEIVTKTVRGKIKVQWPKTA